MNRWKYDGFISYSTRADGDLAPKLQDALEQLAKPWNKRRALKIFQDIDDLAANPDLETTLRHELIGSNTMVFLASEEAAQSKWCADELEFWIDERPADQLVVVLTKGTLVFDKDREFPTVFESSTAAPPAFAKLTSVPLYIDMTYDDASVEFLDHRTNPDFRAKATKVAAALHSNRTGTEVEPRDIDSRDLAEHLKARRLRRIAIALLTLLAVAAVSAAVVADQQRRAAERLTAEATSRAHGANSLAVVDTQPDLAALLALEATRPADAEHPPEARRALRTAANSPWQATLALPYSGDEAAFTDDGRRLVIVDDQPSVWDLDDNTDLVDFGTSGWGDVTSLALNDDSSLLVAGGSTGALIRDVAGSTVAMLTSDEVRSVEFSRDGNLIVAAGPHGATVWDASGHLVAQIDAGDLRRATIDPDGSRVLTVGAEGFVMWDLDGTRLLELTSTDGDSISDDIPTSAEFSSDGRRIATAADERVILWDDSGEQLAVFSRGEAQVDDDGEVSNRVSTVAFDAASRHIVSAGPTGTVVWTIADGDRIELPTGPTISAAYSRDGRQIVTVAPIESSGVGRSSTPSSLCPPPDVCDGSAGGSADGSESTTELPTPTDPSVADHPDRRVEVWSLNAAEVLALVPAEGDSRFDSATFSIDGMRLVTTDATGAKVWDGAGNQVADATMPNTVSAVLDDDGSRVFVAAGEELLTITSIDLADGGRRQVLTDRATGAPVIKDDGTRLAVTTPEEILIWDLTGGGTPVEVEPLPIPAQRRVAFDRDWTRLVVPDVGLEFPFTEDSGPGVFDGDGTYLRGVLATTSWEALDPSGSRLATVGDGGIRLWDVRTTDAEDRRLITDGTGGTVAFHPVEQLVVTATDAGVEIWDVTGVRVRVLSMASAVNAEFSRDGRFVIATLEDEVRVWSFPTEAELRADLQRRLGYRGVSYDDVRSDRAEDIDDTISWKIRDFSTDECDRYRIPWCNASFFTG